MTGERDAAERRHATIEATERRAGAEPVSQEEVVMTKRAIAATGAAVMALALVVSPVVADSEYAGIENPIDWRLVLIFGAVGLAAFGAALSLANRGR